MEVIASKSEVTLSNLIVKPSGPFGELSGLELVSGSVASLKIKVPWAHLSSESVTFTAADICLVAKRKTDVKTALRLETLRAAQVARGLGRDPEDVDIDDVDDDDDDDDDGDLAAGRMEVDAEDAKQRKRYLSRVMDNIIVNVHRLSIRFEDEDVVVSADSVAMETTDDAFKAAFVDRTSHVAAPLFRVGVVLGLQVSTIAKASVVVQPMSVAVQMKTDAAARQTILVRTGPVRVVLSSLAQLLFLQSLAPLKSSSSTASRPPESALVMPRAWWAFAIAKVRKRASWKSYMKAFRDRKEYLALARRRDAAAAITALEARLPLSTVLLFRAFAQWLRKARPSLVKRMASRLRRPSTVSPAQAQRMFEAIALERGGGGKLAGTTSLRLDVASLSLRVEDVAVEITQLRAVSQPDAVLQCGALTASHAGKPVFFLAGEPLANPVASPPQFNTTSSVAAATTFMKASVKPRAFASPALAEFAFAPPADLHEALPPWTFRLDSGPRVSMAGPRIVAEPALIQRALAALRGFATAAAATTAPAAESRRAVQWDVSSPEVVIPGLLRCTAARMSSIKWDDVVVATGKFESQPFSAVYNPRLARFEVQDAVALDCTLESLASLGELVAAARKANSSSSSSESRPPLFVRSLAVEISDLPSRVWVAAGGLDLVSGGCSSFSVKIGGVDVLDCAAGLAVGPGRRLTACGPVAVKWDPDLMRPFFPLSRLLAPKHASATAAVVRVPGFVFSSAFPLALCLLDFEHEPFLAMSAATLDAEFLSPGVAGAGGSSSSPGARSATLRATSVAVRDWWNEAGGRVVLQAAELVRDGDGAVAMADCQYEHWHSLANEAAEYWEHAVAKVAQLRESSAGVRVVVAPARVRLWPAAFAKDLEAGADALWMRLDSVAVHGATRDELAVEFAGLLASYSRGGGDGGHDDAAVAEPITTQPLSATLRWTRELLTPAQQPTSRERVLGLLKGQRVVPRRRQVLSADAELDGVVVHLAAVAAAKLVAAVASHNLRDWRRAEPVWDDADKAPDWTRSLEAWKPSAPLPDPDALFDVSLSLAHPTVQLSCGTFVLGSLVQLGLRVSRKRERVVTADVFGDVSSKDLYLSGEPSVSWQASRLDGDERAALCLGAVTRSTPAVWLDVAKYAAALASVRLASLLSAAGARAVSVLVPLLKVDGAVARGAEATLLRTARRETTLLHAEAARLTLPRPFDEAFFMRVDASRALDKPWRLSLATGDIALKLNPAQLKIVAAQFAKRVSRDTATTTTTAATVRDAWEWPKAVVALASVPAVSVMLTSTTDAPALAIKSSRVAVKYDSTGEHVVASLTFLHAEDDTDKAGLAVDFFNLHLVQWEPLVEPFVFDVVVEASDTTRSLAVDVARPLRVNASPAMLHALSRLSPNVRDVGSAPAALSLSQWTLRNETGLAFELKQGRRSYKCAHGETVALSHWSARAECALDFGADWHPIAHLRLDRIGTETHPLYPVRPPQRRRTMVCVSAALVNGSMVLTAFGAMQIINATDEDLDVLLLPEPQAGFDQDNDGIKEAALARGGASLTLSVLDIARRVSFRPSRAQTADFWNGMALSQLQNAVPVQGECASPLGGFYFNLAVSKEPSGRVRIEVLPTVLVYNGLPVPLSWRLVASASRSTLAPGTIGRAHGSRDDVLMSISLQGSAWSALFKVDVDSTRPVQIEDAEGKVMNVIVETLSERGGSRRVVVYARAWFLNKTGLNLAFKAGAARLLDAVSQSMGINLQVAKPAKIAAGSLVELLQDDLAVPARVSEVRADGTYDVVVLVGEDEQEVCVGGVSLHRLRLPPSHDYILFSESYCSLRVEDDPGSYWSEAFSVDEAKARGFAVMQRVGARPANMLGDSYCLAVDVEPSPMSWKRTPIVVLRPQCVVVNELKQWAVVLSDAAGTHRVRVPPASKLALHCEDFKARLSLDETGGEASSPALSPQASSSLTLAGYAFSGVLQLNGVSAEAVTVQNKRSGAVVVLSVCVTMDKAQVVVTVGADPRQYLVANRSPSMVFFRQAHRKSAVVQSVMPGETKSFGFEETAPEGRAIEVTDATTGAKTSVKPDVLNLPAVALGASLWVRIEVERTSKVIIVAPDKDGARGDYAPRLGADNVQIRQAFFRCSEVVFSVMDTRPQELLCVYLRGVELAAVRQEHSEEENDYSVVVEAKYCQVDNCVVAARFPVVVWPQTLPRTFARVFVAGRRSGAMLVLSEARVSVQPVDVFVEEALAVLLLRWARDCRRAWTALSPTATAAPTMSTPASNGGVGSALAAGTGLGAAASMDSQLLIDWLHVDPIKLTLSMQRLVDDPDRLFGFPEWRGPGSGALEAYDWRPLVSSLGLSFADVDRASVTLRTYEVRRALTTPRGLTQMARSSYERDALANLYYVVSTEFITSLVAPAFGGGIRPATDGGDFKRIGHLAAYTTLDSASKSFGAVGSGLAFLSLDPGFMAARRAQIIDDRPEGFADGVVQAARSLGLGLIEGVGGVIALPLWGAQNSGVEGFVVGVGRGLVGVAVKPAVAVFDSLASLLAGARSGTAALDPAAPPRRCRLPRAFYGKERVATPYNPREALVQELLVRVWGADQYLALAGDVAFELLSHNQVVVEYACRVLCLDYDALVQAMDAPLKLRSAAVDVLWEVDGRAIIEAWPASAEAIQVHLAYKATCFVGFKGSETSRRTSGDPFIMDDVLHIPVHSQQDGRAVLNALLKIHEIASGGDKPKRGPFGLSTGRSAVGWGDTPRTAERKRAGSASEASAGILPNEDPLGRCFVHKVDAGSPAEQAGFAVGDCVLACMGRSLDVDDVDGRALHEALARLPSGSLVNVMVQRRERIVVLEFTLA